MIEGVHSAFLSDVLTYRQIYVERAKTALHAEYDKVTIVVLAAVLQALAQHRVTRFDMTNKRTLTLIVSDVLKEFDIASRTYTKHILDWLVRYTRDETVFFSSSIRAAIELPQEDEAEQPAEQAAVWPLIAGTIVGATGLTIQQTLNKLLSDQRMQIRQTIQRARAMNMTTEQLLAFLQGTPSRLLKDGLMTKMRNFAATTVDTLVQFGMSASRLQAMQKFMDYVVGYTWVSVLDARTSDICRSLSGQRFRYGQGPVPPMHLRCRSHIEPIFSLEAMFREGFSKAFTAGETYYQWLKRQSADLQDDVLGPTKGRLFRSGGLTADQFAVTVVDRKFQPLTLAELRKKRPDAFKNAGL